MLAPEDLITLGLTARLSLTVTCMLFVIGTPLAWWLARSTSRLSPVISAIVALPMVLPPSVLGFYLLLAMGPQGWLGQVSNFLGLGLFPFTFNGLVIASCLYSLPFMVQPLQSTFEGIGDRPLEVAATLRASPLDTFFSVVIPLSFRGFLTAGVMTFAHTVGEFGVVLMIGGNLAGETRLASIQIYDHVQALEYPAANRLSLVLLLFSFLVLFGLHLIKTKKQDKR